MKDVFILTILVLSAFPALASDHTEEQRNGMVDRQIVARGVTDQHVLAAMRKVPRHLFVPKDMQAYAYDDSPLPISDGQTISQPFIVAYMTQAVAPGKDDRVLEIGTGSGYQAAILAELAAEVYTIEIVENLAKGSAARLKEMKYDNIFVKLGDGWEGWPEQAPFDVIVVTAAPDSIPETLTDQLAEGGRMIVPVGETYQELILIMRNDGELYEKRLLPVRFVPMIKGNAK